MQQRAYEEVRHVLKGKAAPTTISELNELKYVDCVLRETLRLYPILPFLTRKTTEDMEIGAEILKRSNLENKFYWFQMATRYLLVPKLLLTSLLPTEVLNTFKIQINLTRNDLHQKTRKADIRSVIYLSVRGQEIA